MFKVLFRVEAQIRLIVGAHVNGEPPWPRRRFDQNFEMGGWIIRPVMQDLPRLAPQNSITNRHHTPLANASFLAAS
jgi:hypothetical protein